MRAALRCGRQGVVHPQRRDERLEPDLVVDDIAFAPRAGSPFPPEHSLPFEEGDGVRDGRRADAKPLDPAQLIHDFWTTLYQASTADNRHRRLSPVRVARKAGQPPNCHFW